MPNPIMPRHEHDPTGTKPLRDASIRTIQKRMRAAAKQVRELVAKLPHSIERVPDDEAPGVPKSAKRKASLKANAEFVDNHQSAWDHLIGWNDWHGNEITKEWLANEARTFAVNAQRYTWQVDPGLMDQTMATIRAILSEALVNGDESWTRRWWMNAYLDSAYARGTQESLASAKLITAGAVEQATSFQLSILTAENVLQTAPYLRRLQLVRGRVFEGMAGVEGDTVADLRRVLTDSMARGLGIRDISGMINDRIGVGLSRATRIARTEMSKAYTDAYMQESLELNDTALADDDWMIKQMHISALAPTTRPDHAARHGKVYTVAEQTNWWDAGSNRIQCLCSVADVLVNRKNGEMLQQTLVDRTRKRGKEYFGKS